MGGSKADRPDLWEGLEIHLVLYAEALSTHRYESKAFNKERLLDAVHSAIERHVIAGE